MDRRTVLTGIGVGVTSSIAGCSSSEGERAAGAQNRRRTTSKNRDVRTLRIGETAKLKNGVRATITGIEFKDQLVRKGSAVNPEKGNKFAIVSIRTKNKGKNRQQLPRAITLKLKANGKSYSTTSYTGSEYTEYQYRGGQSDPGAVRDGELRFEIPRSISKEELTVQWTYTELRHPVVIKWKQ